MNTVDHKWRVKQCFFVSHLYFDRVKRPSSGWMAVTSITHYYYMITKKFENLHALQRKIKARALLPDAWPSRPILAVKRVTYIPALRLNTVQPIGPLTFFFYPGELILPRTLCQLAVYWHPQDHGVLGQKNVSIQENPYLYPQQQALDAL